MKEPQPKSILSIDIGKKRIGLAGCDPLGITVIRLPPLIRKSFNEDIKLIQHYCEERSVEGLVIGNPLNDQGESTKQSIFCTKYGLKIATYLSLPVAWVNEHSSTWQAGEEYGLRNDRSGLLDSAVAALLLEQWLREGPEPKPVKMPAY